jgi:hypothetical protein
MILVCAWCGKNIPQSEGERSAENIISHGICDECRNRFFGENRYQLDLFLDTLNIPVLVVDGDVEVNYANIAARELLDKKLPAVRGFKSGDVFECAYARLPGGCGHTLHCTGCVIRRTVTETFDSGISREKVPATLNRLNAGKVAAVKVLISTEKTGDLVLLRIDAMGQNETPSD